MDKKVFFVCIVFLFVGAVFLSGCTSTTNVRHICHEGTCFLVEGSGPDECLTNADCEVEIEEVILANELGYVVYAGPILGARWTDCSTVDGGFSAVDNYCKCLGYSGVASKSEDPCYLGLGEFTIDNRKYLWDTSECPPSRGEMTEEGTPLTIIKCVV
jgi:hypothetical protein